MNLQDRVDRVVWELQIGWDDKLVKIKEHVVDRRGIGQRQHWGLMPEGRSVVDYSGSSWKQP